MARIGRSHVGQRERGTIRLYVGSATGVPPASSAHCSRQPRSSIFGSAVDHDVEKAADAQPDDGRREQRGQHAPSSRSRELWPRGSVMLARRRRRRVQNVARHDGAEED